MNFKQLNEAFENKYTPDEMLNEAKKPEIISYSDYKQKHNDIAGLNTKNAPVEISEDNFKEQLRDVGKPELIGDAEDFFRERQSKFAIAANTDSKNEEKNKQALERRVINASAEDEVEDDDLDWDGVIDESLLEENSNLEIDVPSDMPTEQIYEHVFNSLEQKFHLGV